MRSGPTASGREVSGTACGTLLISVGWKRAHSVGASGVGVGPKQCWEDTSGGRCEEREVYMLCRYSRVRKRKQR